ncbi:hypothetical protein BAY59_02620 [Prauserella coralliicola]|nr:hypothetical protein BAY59_02620 [Prauserella coralliicola]
MAKVEVLSALVVALALIPEAISFSIIAGVDVPWPVYPPFAGGLAHLVNVTAVADPDGGQVVYSVTGELFFASSNDLVYQFDYTGDPERVVIDLTAAHIWDASTVAAAAGSVAGG